MQKDNRGFIQFRRPEASRDDSVNAALRRGLERQAEQRMTKRERQKKEREQRKAEARRGRRATYDLDPALIQSVARLAEEHETSASQIAGLAIALLLDGIERGQIDIRDFYIPIENPYYARKLKNPKIACLGDTPKIRRGHPQGGDPVKKQKRA